MQTRPHPVLLLCLSISVLLALGVVLAVAPVEWSIVPLCFIVFVGAVPLSAAIRGLSWKRGPREPVSVPAEDSVRSRPEIPELGRRANRAFGPILAGVVIDIVDFATFGPIGLLFGFPVGGIVGYWMGRALGLSTKASIWCGVAAGIYCTVPGTEFIPLATIVGACVRFRDSGKKRSAEEAG